MVKSNEKNKTETRDQYTVVLEDLRSDFKVFGESLDFVKDKVSRIDERLIKVESDLEILKAEVALIRHNQVTRDEFKLLESRVLHLENKLSH